MDLGRTNRNERRHHTAKEELSCLRIMYRDSSAGQNPTIVLEYLLNKEIFFIFPAVSFESFASPADLDHRSGRIDTERIFWWLDPLVDFGESRSIDISVAVYWQIVDGQYIFDCMDFAQEMVFCKRENLNSPTNDIWNIYEAISPSHKSIRTIQSGVGYVTAIPIAITNVASTEQRIELTSLEWLVWLS